MVTLTDTRPVMLLSLDGGGVRGYSELVILERIMWRIKWKKLDKLRLTKPTAKLDEIPEPLPCDYFDLIGGSSTGGIIAILLGRLRLRVSECLKLYERLSKDIFGNEQSWSLGGVFRSRYDSKVLAAVVKDTVQKNETRGDPEAFLRDTNSDNSKPCYVFVTTSKDGQPERNQPVLLRSYTPKKGDPGITCKIWEATRATSAAPKFFDPMPLTDDHGHTAMYVDGGVGCNNPCNQVLSEALDLFDNRPIGCLVSLGTGLPKVLPHPEAGGILDYVNPMRIVTNGWDYVELLIRIATDCDKIHQDFLAERTNVSPLNPLPRDKYFRFNVQQGAQDISLFHYEKLREIRAHTTQ
ncbi:FabD/lysophospholipase-like protein [Serendipita vermifera]|nr:FabD/lysophospholipase-like protein [Serendipita vermifera]